MSGRAHEPAYPCPELNVCYGMSIREQFAILLSSDEIAAARSQLSKLAKEKIVGREMPGPHGPDTPGQLDRQIDACKWHMELAAALRCMAADALIEALEKT